MARFVPGDRVRIDIPDETDPDHERYHGREGTVVELLADDASEEARTQAASPGPADRCSGGSAGSCLARLPSVREGHCSVSPSIGSPQ